MAKVRFTSLTSASSITTALRQLSAQEATLDETLQIQISNRSKLKDELELIQSVVPVLGRIEKDGKRMDERINETADVAERIGGIIGKLDEEQSRVQDCISMVQSVQDLKNSLLALESAVESSDWESATRHYHRCVTIPTSVITSKFAEAVVPTATLPSPPEQTLKDFSEKLLKTFLENFKQASKDRDETKISRFFKLFPMIEKEDQGLKVYAEFVSQIVTGRMNGLMNGEGSKTSHPNYYSALLTSLFENIALLISQHQPVIEKYYGTEGKVARVLEKVQSECCNQLGCLLLNKWQDNRRIIRKIEDISSYRYPLLTSLSSNSFSSTPPQRPTTPLLNINSTTASRFVNIQPPFRQNTIPPQISGNPGLGITVTDDGDNIAQLRDVDGILIELALMQGRWELYRRFIYSRAGKPLTSPIVEGEGERGGELEVEEIEYEELEFLENSTLKNSLQDRMDKFYRIMEIWFIRSSIEKAHQMDEADFSSSPYLSSALDDTFYILKKVLNRIFSTASIRTVQSLIPSLQEIMIKDFNEILRKRMENVYSNIPSNGSIEKEKEARLQFIVYLNDLEIGSEYMNRLGDEILGGESIKSGFWKSDERKLAKELMEELKKNVSENLNQLVKAGINQLFNQLVRPKLRNLMAECYKDVSYELDEDGHSEAEFQDLVRKRFIKGWEQLIDVFRDSLTLSNYHQFFSMTVTVLVRPWETIIRGLKFTELGGLKFDRDLRTIMTYLSSQTSFGSGVMRDAFARLQHISALLTLESPEDADDVGGRLTQHEIKAVLAQRISSN